jgi:hypothetical protein
MQIFLMFDVKKFEATYHHKLQFNSKDYEELRSLAREWFVLPIPFY